MAITIKRSVDFINHTRDMFFSIFELIFVARYGVAWESHPYPTLLARSSEQAGSKRVNRGTYRLQSSFL